MGALPSNRPGPGSPAKFSRPNVPCARQSGNATLAHGSHEQGANGVVPHVGVGLENTMLVEELPQAFMLRHPLLACLWRLHLASVSKANPAQKHGLDPLGLRNARTQPLWRLAQLQSAGVISGARFQDAQSAQSS